MKPHIEVSTVERTGIAPEDESSFTIRNSPAAFEILSAGIYTDGIAAVIRELSCNAFDAHVEAGKADEPFEIHLPNKLEPWLSIKDNGIGLSDTNVRGLYTTYFLSTKEGTNEQIGEKGLGSKSPFAYSDTFDVISRFEGIMQMYTVYLNEQRMPTITKMGDAIATDESNGLEVKITIKEEDFYEFAETTAKILKYFPVRPTIKGSARFEFDNLPEDRYEGDGYFTSRGDRWASDKFTAVMGNVPYRVDTDKVNKLLTGAEREFLNAYKIVAFFPLGDLATAASREEIQYGKRSVSNLVDMIKKARVDFLQRTDEDMVEMTKDIDDRWEAYCLLADKFDNVRSLLDIASDFKWSADIVNEWIESDGRIDFMTPDYHTMVCYQGGRARALRRKDYTNNSVPHSATIVPQMHHDVVVLMDVRVRSSLRLNQYLHTLDGRDNVITITQTREKTIQERQPNLKKIDYKADFDATIAGIGNPKVVKLSEVSTDVKATYTGKRSVGLTFNKFLSEWYPNNGRSRRPGWQVVDAPDVGEKCIYMLVETMSKKMALRDGTVKDWSHRSAATKVKSMLSVINAVKGTNYKATEVYGLTKKVVKSIKDNTDWTNIFDLFEESANEMVHVYDYFANKNATPRDNGIKDMVFHHRFKKVCEKYLHEDSYFRTELVPFFEQDELMRAELKRLSEDNITTIRNLGTEVNLEGFNDLAEPKSLFDYKVVLDKYPMLRLVGYNTMMSDVEILFNYIADVDAKNA